jgi:hypothetical protein
LLEEIPDLLRAQPLAVPAGVGSLCARERRSEYKRSAPKALTNARKPPEIHDDELVRRRQRGSN